MILKELPPEVLNDENIRVQKIEFNELEQTLDTTFFPYVFRLIPDSDYGYIRDWRLPGSGEEVHEGYAFQWFAFATTLLLIYLVMNIKKTK